MSIDLIDGFELLSAGDRTQPDEELTCFFGDITTMYAAAVIQAILRQSEAAANSESQVIAEQLITSLESQRPAKPLWDLSLGQIRYTKGSGGTGDGANLAQFALHVGSVQPVGPWEAKFPQPYRFRVGSTVLEAIEAITHDGTDEYRYRTAGSNRWHSANSPSIKTAEMHCVTNPFGTSLVLRRDTLPTGLGIEVDPKFTRNAAAVCASIWRDALELLKDCAPSYAEWVQRGVRAVIPVDNPPEVLLSGSDDRRPSVITASANTTIDGMAEILVHEATHQYMYAATKASPLDDGTDTSLYYSPVKGANRPISKILIAFHAVGNVLLLATRLTDLGHDHGHYWRKNLDRLVPQATVLDDALAKNKSLTHVGNCLYLPLRRALKRNGLLP